MTDEKDDDMNTEDHEHEHLDVDELARPGDPAVAHSMRFRKVSTRYPLQVTYAYDGDTAAALADTDEEVAARVVEWERQQGMSPRDWYAIGAEERGE
jgi:hypothetical protein